MPAIRLVHEDGTLCLSDSACSRRTHYLPDEVTPRIVQDTLYDNIIKFHASLSGLKAGLHTASLLCTKKPDVHLLVIATLLVDGAHNMLTSLLEGRENTRSTDEVLGNTFESVGRVAEELG